MMESFAQRYCQLNPDIFTNSDTCYVLSFSVIMLNTSLHNPSVKQKPSVEEFISMNRGINDGGDLPKELLMVRGEGRGKAASYRSFGINSQISRRRASMNKVYLFLVRFGIQID